MRTAMSKRSLGVVAAFALLGLQSAWWTGTLPLWIVGGAMLLGPALAAVGGFTTSLVEKRDLSVGLGIFLDRALRGSFRRTLVLGVLVGLGVVGAYNAWHARYLVLACSPASLSIRTTTAELGTHCNSGPIWIDTRQPLRAAAPGHVERIWASVDDLPKDDFDRRSVMLLPESPWKCEIVELAPSHASHCDTPHRLAARAVLKLIGPVAAERPPLQVRLQPPGPTVEVRVGVKKPCLGSLDSRAAFVAAEGCGDISNGRRLIQFDALICADDDDSVTRFGLDARVSVRAATGATEVSCAG